ncbi:hypothetical protein ABTX15_03865 [Micromonospora sp. NPDC094482]|uniref:hypothetical protein n=1 Tax=unclassified Micromonospora TaxID=2617518 RepID=UPI00331B7723
MFRHSVRRWLAGISAAGALIAVGATPAVAAPGQLRIASRDVLVAPGHSALGYIDVRIEGQDLQVRLDIDASELAALGGFELTDNGWDCTRSANLLRCTTTADRWGRTPRLYYRVSARADATLGDEAQLSITGTSAVGTASRTTTATVVEGIDLQTEPRAPLAAAPGARLELPSTVRNAGPVPVDGAVLVFTADWLLGYTGNFRNCRHQEGLPTICRFDTELRPGVSYRLSVPLPLALRQSARSGLVLVNRLQWWTTDDWALVERAPDESLPPDTPGTGEELRLVEQPATRQTETSPWDSFTAVDLRVTGDQTADAAAVGRSTSARPGDRVRVSPGFDNLGPAAVETWRMSPLVRVGIPEGSTAVTVPETCAPIGEGEWKPGDTWGQLGARAYGCRPQTDFAFPGRPVTFTFTLRVDRLTTPTSAPVTIDMPGDTNAANDTAQITLTPRSAARSGVGGGNDDSLPITGGSTGALAALGVLLFAAGLTGHLVTRRRRTRFVA